MFFTLSLAFGALIAFASYMPHHNQCMNDAYTVVFINCGTSLFAGVVVYSILGYREIKTGIPANKVYVSRNLVEPSGSHISPRCKRVRNVTIVLFEFLMGQ